MVVVRGRKEKARSPFYVKRGIRIGQERVDHHRFTIHLRSKNIHYRLDSKGVYRKKTGIARKRHFHKTQDPSPQRVGK
jgi:hypothetical protein